MKRSVLGIVGLCLMAWPALSVAQSRGDLPPASYLTLRQQSAWLLNYRGVVFNLALSAAERKALQQAQQAYDHSEQQLTAHGAPSDDQIQGLDVKFSEAALAALTPGHRERLYQALLQVQGAEALTDRGIASRLGLSSGERERVHEIFAQADKREEDFEASFAQKLLAVPRIAPAKLYVQKRSAVVAAAEPQRQKLAKQREADESEALKVLSNQQQSKWREMLGAPFPLSRQRG